MKKLFISTIFAFAAFSAFAYDSSVFTPNGKFSSYTQTSYSVTSKFGNYFRSVDAKDVYVFDDTGLKLETSTYNAKDELLGKLQFKYDTSRNLSSETFVDANGNVLWTTKIEYETDGKLKSDSEYDANNKLISRIIYKYEDSKITEDYYDGDGALLTRKIQTVNENNKPLEIVQYFGDGSLNMRQVYNYLSSGKISSVEEYDGFNNIREKTLYKYDANEVLAEVQVYNGVNVLIQRKSYRTDSRGNPTRISVYKVAQKFGTTVNELQSITEYVYKQ